MISIISLFLFIILIFNNKLLVTSVRKSLYIYSYLIIPSLFIFFILTDILINSNIIKKIGSFLDPYFKRIFHLRYKESSFIILSSFLVGNPNNAKMVLELYKNNSIDLNEANHLLSFNSYTSLSFIVIVIGGILNDFYLTIIVLISHFFSNIIIGIFKKNKQDYYLTKEKKENNSKKNIVEIIEKNINIILFIGASLCIFGILIDCLNLISFLKPYNFFISPFLEITRGITDLKEKSINIGFLTCFISSFISFNGLSIHFQVYSIIKGELSYLNYLKYRIIQMILSLIISFSLYKLIYKYKYFKMNEYAIYILFILIIIVLIIGQLKKINKKVLFHKKREKLS